jgi:acetyl esterase
VRQLGARLERFVLRQLLGLPVGWRTRLQLTRPIQIDGLTLHAEIQLSLAAWRCRTGGHLRAVSPLTARAFFQMEAQRHPIQCEVSDVQSFCIPTEVGLLAVRHYAPAESGAPLLVFFHGGGFVLGSLDTHDALCRLLCRHAALHVLAVDYRLAPENPFPAAVDDAVAAFSWAQRNAGALGADASRVCVGGDDAGGNLSAVVAQQTRHAGWRAPAAQLLIYPQLEAQEETRARALFANGFALDREDLDWFISQYAQAGKDLLDRRLSPARIEDASGLCPAFIVTAGFDPLRDEAEAYARKLCGAGVLAKVNRYGSLVHGFLQMAGVSPVVLEVAIELATSFGAFVREMHSAARTSRPLLRLVGGSASQGEQQRSGQRH